MAEVTPEARAYDDLLREGLGLGMASREAIGYADAMMRTTHGHALVVGYAFADLREELAATRWGRFVVWSVERLNRVLLRTSRGR